VLLLYREVTRISNKQQKVISSINVVEFPEVDDASSDSDGSSEAGVGDVPELPCTSDRHPSVKNFQESPSVSSSVSSVDAPVQALPKPPLEAPSSVSSSVSSSASSVDAPVQALPKPTCVSDHSSSISSMSDAYSSSDSSDN